MDKEDWKAKQQKAREVFERIHKVPKGKIDWDNIKQGMG
jgi:hypothetical protein